MSQTQRRKLDWSLLPQELLEKIAESTGSRIERLRFRAVCKKWRSSCFYPVSTSLLYPTLPKPIPILSSSILTLSNRPIYIVGCALYLIQPPIQDSTPDISSKSWIVSIEELNRRRYRVRFPLTKTHIKDLPNDFPKSINVSNLQLAHIGEGLKLCYSNGNEDVFRFEGFPPCCNYPTSSKVVMFLDEDSHTDDTWSVMVLLLGQGGSLGTLKLDGQWSYIDLGPGFRFDDVISLNRDGKLCGIDSEGRAYLIDGSECRIIRTMSDPLCTIHTHCYARNTRKLLSLIKGLIFMIVRNKEKFEVYLLQKEEHSWIQMSDMGDWILFTTFDSVIPVEAKRIPGSRGNCIVFPKNLFALHSREFCKDYKLFQGANKYIEVGVYYLDEDRCRPVSSEPAFSELFWPPPSWLSPDSESQTSDSKEEDEDMGFFTNSYASTYNSEGEESRASLQRIEEDTAAFPDHSQSSHGDKSQQEIQDENNDGPVPVDSCPNEKIEDIASQIFERLEVNPDLLPVLHKIWAKYGNIIYESVVCSDGLMKWAVESLAKMITILQNNTRSSLDDFQAEFLKSTLADLQPMNIKLDWLVPYVERALALHSNNEHVDTMMELETTRSKLRAELRELEARLADQKKFVRENIPDSTPLILEESCPLFLI